MDRINSYEDLENDIVSWLKDYYWQYSIKAFVVGVSGGIDSAVVSTLCARTGLPTYILTMPLDSSPKNTELSDAHALALKEKYDNVTHYNKREFTASAHANANTKSRIRMVTLYQIAGSVGGIVVGTGNKVEDYGVGFYTKYGDGGVDIAPIADLYKSEVWELGEYLGVDQRIVDAQPTDGLWGDSRTDESQLGASYPELEEAMETGKGPGVDVLNRFNRMNKHKMEPIPTFTL